MWSTAGVVEMTTSRRTEACMASIDCGINSAGPAEFEFYRRQEGRPAWREHERSRLKNPILARKDPRPGDFAQHPFHSQAGLSNFRTLQGGREVSPNAAAPFYFRTACAASPVPRPP
jgi:hypothetical protein